MDKTHTSPVAKNYLKNFVVRLGIIFSNMAILSLILCLSGIASFVALAFVFIIGFAIIIFSVGTIFVVYPNYFQTLMSAGTVTGQIADFFMNTFYIFASICILTSILSLVLLILDKRKKHVARIVISSIIIAVVLVFIIVFALGVAK